ncbi:MAG: insulinase family protein, partial [Ardenticatenales bacterium]|nr:insulinase family protein [Ardenticatenales bacterium]
VTFRTPPTDSTGLPHILEHSVLCGSRKYPVKEPFVELIKGSLNTFLNAFTYPDKTCYPIASQNLQDFYNLMDVYLDAVFYPRLTPQVLQQEGWHYEVESGSESLSYKGVVFNEMKGAYASPEARVGKAVQQSLFPDNTYGVDSGGDPTAIPDLTFEQFKAFHERYYHPSNARLFFYGDDEPEERLRRMAEYLDEFERLEVESAVALQPRFDAPKRIVQPYPVSSDEAGEKKGIVAVNWLLTEGSDPEHVMALHILDYILVGKAASPLRKALIESRLGEDLTSSGVAGEFRQMYFTVGLKGIKLEDVERIETLIEETLRQLAEQGIERETIEAGLNATEFNFRENNSGSYPRGLLLMLRSLTTWLHDGDPFAPLAFEGPLGRIKARLAAGEALFETLIREHLLENLHRTTVILEPDAALNETLEAEERARLDAVQETMDESALQRVMEEAQALKAAQETPDAPEALACIPSLTLADLERENKLIPCEVEEIAGTTFLYHDLFTNGIAYLDLGMNLHLLPQTLLPYVPLFGRALLELGTESEDFVKLSQRIDRTTGGIRPTTLITPVRGSRRGETWLFLRGKAMLSQVGELLSILRDLLLTVRLDNRERFRQMVLVEKARYEASLIPSGHRVINRRMRAHFNEADWAYEQMENIEQLFFLRQLAERVESDWPSILATLEEIRTRLVNRRAMLGNVTLDAQGWQEMRPQLEHFLSGLPEATVELASWQTTTVARAEGLTIPAQVNYVGKAANLYDLGYQFDGSSLVISRYLRTGWLWERVRVQGGAYGAFGLLEPRSGIFSYLSYRDPNLLDTLEIYDLTGDFLRRLELSEEELSKGIIGTIGDLDMYMLPDAKGYVSLDRYLARESDESRQKLREEVLSTSTADFRAFADELDKIKDAAVLAVLGGQPAIEEANEALGGKLTITKVL